MCEFVKHVYLNEFQVHMQDGISYLPYASGLLAAYSKSKLPPGEFVFHVNEPMIFYPYVAAFSVSLWNLRASIQKAKEIKKVSPGTTIVFGGPSCSEVHDLLDFPALVFDGEGEDVFYRLLRDGYSSVPDFVMDIDSIPSPYLTGVFDDIVKNSRQCQAIVETSRGCPFQCSYCSWGKGSKRIRSHSLEYIRAEAEWMGINKIPYVFCADGNFGMMPQDPVVAKIYADVKRRYGYPEKFRVCYGKNAEETIFETASILAEAGLAKTVTISRQSTNPATLEAIRRKNVSQHVFSSLQRRYHDANIPTYTELMLGLPEESYESFVRGIQQSIESYDTQLFIYPVEVLPGTQLADTEYRKKYGIVTRKTLLTPVHALPLNPKEYEEIVISTSTMDIDSWMRAFVLSRVVQFLYSLKVINVFPFVSIYEKLMDPEVITSWPRGNNSITPIWKNIVSGFYAVADGLVSGRGRCQIIPEFGKIYWEPEEAAFLSIARHHHEFYAELRYLFGQDSTILREQEESFPALFPNDDPVKYARNVLLYGRKNNQLRRTKQ